MVDQTIPKQELLVKLLKLTTSDNDGECLAAIRKANALLTAASWDWDKLISGKIVVVGDPFGEISDPRAARQAPVSTGPISTKPAPPPALFRGSVATPIATAPNKYVGFCYCCGKEVVAGVGYFFKPKDRHAQGVDSFRVVCAPCNISATVFNFPASRVKTPRRTSVSDLA